MFILFAWHSICLYQRNLILILRIKCMSVQVIHYLKGVCHEKN
jgi:hypothetical protein